MSHRNVLPDFFCLVPIICLKPDLPVTEKGLAAGANDHRSIFVLMAVEESDVSMTEKASISAAEGRSAQLVFEVIEHR